MLGHDAPSVRPEVLFTEQILEEISRGHLRIPRFQRPFVWKPSDMLNLFDSMYRGYPIGSLLIWESTDQVESLDHVGPLAIPTPIRRPVAYVLDGQQRLCTLFAALHLPREFPLTTNQEQWKWWIWFDLREKIFTHVPDGRPAPWLLPVRSVLRTVEFLAEARRLEAENPTSAPEFIAEAERLAQKIKSYKLATVRIEGGDLIEAVDIFSRLNSRGRVMAPDQMISALTYREGPEEMDLASRINQILQELGAFNFGQVNRQTIFRSILAAGEHDIHSREWNALASNVANELAQTAEAARASLGKAAAFLNQDVGVVSDRYLPYSYQLLLLSEFFRLNPNPLAANLNTLRQWFWATSFSGWFAGANTTNIDHAVEEMRAFASGKVHSFNVTPLSAPARPYPRRFDARSARIRALLVFLINLKPRDLRTGLTVTATEFGPDSGKLFQQVFPNLKTPLVSDPANRMLVERMQGRNIRDSLRSVSASARDDILRSHAITPAAYSALERDDGYEFVRLRSQHLMKIEREFMGQMGVALPAHEASDDLETDSDSDSSVGELTLFEM